MSNLPLRKNGILVVIIGICVLTAMSFMKQYGYTSVPETAEAKSAYTLPRQIRYSFTLQNTTNNLLPKAEFWAYAPVKQTATQRCINLEASHPYQLVVDESGNQILHFVLTSLPPFSNATITIKADLLLSDSPNPVAITDLEPYLRPEKYIESNDASLMALAEALRSSERTKTAENIFSWVADNVDYSGFSGTDRGALYTLRKKKGDCTEFMYLFAALCRASNIPTRCVGGYICKKNGVLQAKAYHNWAEIYDDGTWQTVDPQKRIFMDNPSHYIAMHILGDINENPMGMSHRFRSAGVGLKVHMNGG